MTARHTVRIALSVLCAVAAVVVGTTLLQSAAGDDHKLVEVQARYRQWERSVPADSSLGRIKPLLERKYTVLPAGDLEDKSPLPLWFRVYMRLQHPDLRTSGPDQYGRTANRVLQALLDEPNDPEIDQLAERLKRAR